MKVRENSKLSIFSAVLLFLAAGVNIIALISCAILLHSFTLVFIPAMISHIILTAILIYTACGILKNKKVQNILNRFILCFGFSFWTMLLYAIIYAIIIILFVCAIFAIPPTSKGALELMLFAFLLCLLSSLFIIVPEIVGICIMLKKKKKSKFLIGFSFFLLSIFLIYLLHLPISLICGGLLAYIFSISSDVGGKTQITTELPQENETDIEENNQSFNDGEDKDAALVAYNAE